MRFMLRFPAPPRTRRRRGWLIADVYFGRVSEAKRFDSSRGADVDAETSPHLSPAAGRCDARESLLPTP